MVQPIQYQTQFPQGLPDPTRELANIINIAGGIQQLRGRREERERLERQAMLAAQRRQQYEDDVAALGDRPSAQGIAGMILKYPDLQEQLQTSHQILSADEQKTQLDQASQVYSAMLANKPEIARGLLAAQAETYRNEGNEEEAQEREQLSLLIESDPGEAMSATGMYVAAQLGPDEFTQRFERLEKERRARAAHPLEQEAKELGITTKQLDIKKKQAELGKLAERAPAIKDPASGRKEFTALSKDFITSRDAHNRVEVSAQDPSAAGDLALIFNYMKVLDPGSVVREGEFATAQSAGGVPERVRGFYNRVLRGERLDAAQREDFLDRSRRLFAAAGKSQRKLEAQYAKLAEKSNIDPGDVVINFSEEVVTTDADEGAPTPVEAAAARSAEITQRQEPGAPTVQAQRVVETRVLQDGRTLLKYEDGTIRIQ